MSTWTEAFATGPPAFICDAEGAQVESYRLWIHATLVKLYYFFGKNVFKDATYRITCWIETWVTAKYSACLHVLLSGRSTIKTLSAQ